jgi:hypothetical protein
MGKQTRKQAEQVIVLLTSWQNNEVFSPMHSLSYRDIEIG